MGVKGKSRLISVLMALVMVITSGIAVFGADSPSQGAKTPAAKVSYGTTSITVTNAGAKVQYKLSTAKKWSTATVKSGKATIKTKKHKKYQIKVSGTTYYRLTCVSKVKSAKKKGKTVTVKAAKRGCAKKYTFKAVRTSDGKVVTKTVKKPNAKLKLKKGTWKITVTVKNGKYVGKTSGAKKVTIK